jgi:hypothetical protein
MTIFDDIYNIFIKPVADALSNIIKPITDAITPEKSKADATNASTAFETALGTKQLGYISSSPGVPEDLAKQASDQLGPIEGAFMAQTIANIVVESASLGQVDVTVNELSNTPSIQASKQTAMQIRRAEFVEGVYPALRRYHLKHFMPMLPESYRLALAVTKGILAQDVYLASMAESGFSNDWAMTWQEENYVYPNPAQTFELFWRGIIDDATLNLILTRNGYRPDIVAYIKALSYLIPPAGDLITMAVREAFDPQFVTEAPDIFAEYMGKKGYTKEWADRYWTAHWIPVPLAQAYSNLHRGYWSKERFMTALRIADIHPEWREDIYNVAFNPPAIREMGYGFDVGIYTVEDIIKYRKWGGLNQEDAEKAAISLVAYRTEAEREAVRREYLYAYSAGTIDDKELENNLIELGTSPPAVALWIERAQLLRERQKKADPIYEFRIPTGSEAAFAFENGLRSEEWYRAALKTLDWTPERVSLAVDKSKLDMATKRAKEEAVTPRKLTIAQIRNLYLQGYLTVDMLQAEFEKLNYPADTAKRLADLLIAVESMPKAPLKITRAEIVRLYEYRLLGVSDADMYKILQNIIITEGANSPTKALYEEFAILGYETIDAVKLTVWTAIDVALPTLKARYSKGWITATQLYNEIIAIGIPQTKANELMETVIKAEQPERTATEKDLTKAEIIKGAKQQILTVPQASELLQGIGYDENEALYLLYINAVVSRGDPEGYWEMKKVVEQQKKAKGQPFKDIPEDLILLELRLKDAKAELKRLKDAKATDEAIGAQAVAIAGLETNMRVVIAKLKLQ